MSAYRLASRYAKSLLDLSIEQHALEQVYGDVNYFSQVYKKVSEFRTILKNPEINESKKQAVFNQLFKDFHSITKSFLTIVLKKRREEFLGEFADSFIDLYRIKNKITAVTLSTAIEADAATIAKVKDLLRTKAGLENVELTTKINPALLGGFVLQYDDKLFDASILRKLNMLDDQFLNNDYIRKY